MAGLTNYSPKVDLDYAQYHKALSDSVVIRDRITALSKEIGRHGEAMPDATRVDYDSISSLLKDVEKRMYPATDEWNEKINFCVNRFLNAGARGLTFVEIAAYIKDAEKLENHVVSQGMEAAVQVTLDQMVKDGELLYEDGMYSK